MRITKWKLFVLIFLLGWNNPLLAYARDLASVTSAVWEIGDDRNYGTAFAISPNLFMTNAHNLRNAKRIGEIVLSQEGSSRRLGASQVLALSLVHDLMLLQTKETVRRYLRLGGPVSRKEDGALRMMGYRKETLTRFWQIAPVAWQDRFYYALPVNRMNLHGASGSPVVNSRGEVIAMASRANTNIAYGLKARYIKRLLAGEIGVFCSRPRLLRPCFKEGIANMMAMAERGHRLAQYQYSRGVFTNEGEMRMDFLRRSAEQDFTQAEQKLGTYYYKKKDYKRAHHWFIKAAKKNNPVSRYYLGLILYFGKGESARDRKKAYQFTDRAAKAGHVFAKYMKGYMLYYGQGPRKNRRLGIKFLREAAEIGDPEARKLLEKLQR